MALDKKIAVFLDRDGVINKENGLIDKPDKLMLYNYAANAISRLNKNFLVFVVTNQPVIAKGLCTEKELLKIHERLIYNLNLKNAKIDKIYYCPHHPTEGNSAFTKDCECRKPKPGMILQAAEEFGISLKDSFMVGDKTSDIKAGNLAGIGTTIMVKTGFGGNDGFNDAVSDYLAEDLNEAAKIILEARK